MSSSTFDYVTNVKQAYMPSSPCHAFVFHWRNELTYVCEHHQGLINSRSPQSCCVQFSCDAVEFYLHNPVKNDRRWWNGENILLDKS